MRAWQTLLRGIKVILRLRRKDNSAVFLGNSKIFKNDFNSCYVDDTIIYSSISLKKFYEMLDEFGSTYNFGDRYMLSYYSVMCTLIHEISHARQDYIVKNYPYSFYHR